MSSLTRPPARSALVSAVALVLLLGAAGCTGDGPDEGGGEGPSSSSGTDEETVTTLTTLQHVGGRLTAEKRAEIKEAIAAVVDPWFDGAFLGDFPRSDYAGAFTGFTEGAAADAQTRDLAFLTNQPIADRIDNASALLRRIRVDVFDPDGHPRGATAHVVLDFQTTGSLEERLRVRGNLYLSRERGVWKVFGYDVDEAVPL